MFLSITIYWSIENITEIIGKMVRIKKCTVYKESKKIWSI